MKTLKYQIRISFAVYLPIMRRKGDTMKRKFCENTKVASSFRITIPLMVRKLLNIKKGDELVVCVMGEKIIIEKKKKEDEKE